MTIARLEHCTLQKSTSCELSQWTQAVLRQHSFIRIHAFENSSRCSEMSFHASLSHSKTNFTLEHESILFCKIVRPFWSGLGAIPTIHNSKHRLAGAHRLPVSFRNLPAAVVGGGSGHEETASSISSRNVVLL